MPNLVPAGYLPEDAEIGRRGESREDRRRRRQAEHDRKIEARERRREQRLDNRDRRRAAKRGDKDTRRDQQRGRRRRTIEDAGKVVDSATDDDGLLAEYLPPGEDLEAADEEIEELPSTDGFGEDDDGWSAAGWSRLGRLRIQARRGQRAATIELRPGLYLVAEIPDKAIAGIGGPVKLAERVVQAASRALQPKHPQIPGPAPALAVPARRRWRDRGVGCDGPACECRWERD